MPTANIIFSRSSTPPYEGSVSIANAFIERALKGLGYRLRRLTRGASEAHEPSDYFLPLSFTERALQTKGLRKADLNFCDDFGLGFLRPTREQANRTAVFLHGLAGMPSMWLSNPDIDVYCCNSPWLRSVLTSIMLWPDWSKGSVLDARALNVAKKVTLPLPSTRYPDGYESVGDALPAVVKEALSKDVFWGHCIVARKPDLVALYAITAYLAKHRAVQGLKKEFRVFVAETVYRELIDLAARAPIKLRVETAFVPVPYLKNTEVAKLMKASTFCIWFNSVPESFGFYPLESVFNGCPVYTNGCGNTRHLLPPGCGIHVLETERMARGQFSAYEAVAKRILADAHSGAGIAECERGKELIERNYTEAALRDDLRVALDSAACEGADADFDALFIALSPLVRSWNQKTRVILSDYSHARLSPTQQSQLRDLVGMPAKDVRKSRSQSHKVAAAFYRAGLIALTPERVSG